MQINAESAENQAYEQSHVKIVGNTVDPFHWNATPQVWRGLKQRGQFFVCTHKNLKTIVGFQDHLCANKCSKYRTIKSSKIGVVCIVYTKNQLSIYYNPQSTSKHQICKKNIC